MQGLRRYEWLFEVPFDEPCIIILGLNDDDYYKLGQATGELYKDATVLEHAGGHHFPQNDDRGRWIYHKIAEEMLSLSLGMQAQLVNFEFTPPARVGD